MTFENTADKKNQTARFAKLIILAAPFIVAAAGATIYQESKPNLPNASTPVLATRGDSGSQAVESFMPGEPFSRADGVNSLPLEAALMQKATAKLATQPHPGTEPQLTLERFDHSVVNKHSTAHDSDLPGASIGAY